MGSIKFGKKTSQNRRKSLREGSIKFFFRIQSNQSRNQSKITYNGTFQPTLLKNTQGFSEKILFKELGKQQRNHGKEPKKNQVKRTID